MEIWQATLLGLVQGLAEFLPVSSSGHLFLGEYFLGLEPDVNFMIALHLATLLAVCLVYWRQIIILLAAWGRSFVGQTSTDSTLAWQLIIATALTVLVALLIEPYFETILNLWTVGFTLILTGGLVWLSDYLSRRVAGAQQAGNVNAISWGKMLGLGLVQGLAVVPGVSRSGLTIAYLLGLGVDRKKAADVSFLLSIPTILGAGVFMLKDNSWQLSLAPAQWFACGVAFLAAVGAIFWMKQWVETKWLYFAPYCLLVGSVMVLYVIMNGA